MVRLGARGVGVGLVMVLALSMGAVACARVAPAGQSAARQPLWAAQLAWAPSSNSLSIDYNSTVASAPVNGAYDGTPPVFPGGKWQQHTWKLTSVAFGEHQNFGADLRLSGSAGVAVSKVVLSLDPPGQGGPQASIAFAAEKLGETAVTNQDQGLIQVASGGNQGDSLYHVATVAGKPAEVLDPNSAAGPGAASYIYLQLDPSSPVLQAHPSVVYVTITYASTQPAQGWSEQTFAKLAAGGVHAAEINMEWAAVEPSKDQFDFTLLDEDLANAAKAGVKVIPIFWYSVWGGNPAPWITSYDQGSNGALSQVPTWWDPTNRQAYFTYVQRTVAHIKNSPGFGGAFMDYGWLDYMWGPAPGGSGVNGYAPADVARFHQWLPTQYRSLAAFNGQYHTSYSSWSQVPAAKPGEALFPVYQAFRDWSVGETYARLSQIYRQETNAPLYFYWGGGFSGAGLAFNVPDTFFQVAKKYHGIVVLDDADHTGLPLIFHSLAQAYGVPLLEEWTPRPSGLHAEIAEFMGHYIFESPETAGMDFFLYGGGTEYQVGYPVYTHWIPLLSKIRGAYPQQPVALYISYASVNQNSGALSGLSGRVEAIWRQNPTAFAVVTDREIQAGVARLSDFRAVYPLSGAGDANMKAYAQHGGHVLTDPGQLAQYAQPYASFAPTTSLVEVVPAVDSAQHTAWLTVTGVNPSWSYQGNLTLNLAGLGLPAGTYHLVDGSTGKDIPTTATRSGLTLPLQVAPGDMQLWELVPGAGPALSAAATSSSSARARSVSYTPGGPSGGLQVLNITPAGQPATGDGNASLEQVDGSKAVATWTVRQLGTPGAYLYLQLNPASPVYSAQSLQVTVTYLATAGQGFQVQYDGTAGPYSNGPSVQSPGTGQWVTTQVELAGVHLDEGENGQADLRLAVRDGSQPLVVRAITISAPSS